MKNLNIPFKIGMEYENWEFDLEVTQDRIKYFESYIYIGKKFNNFLKNPIDKTELIFSWDILEAVIITFENKDFSFIEKLNRKIKKLNFDLTRDDFQLEIKTSFILTYLFKENKVKLIYFNSKDNIDWSKV
jgi:hypothetical protein